MRNDNDPRHLDTRMIDLTTLHRYCNELLHSADFGDYCPNGLQVESGRPVRRLVTGVTACQALIDAAVAWEADALLVHHGWFWKGEAPVLTGMKGARVRALLQQDIGLLAYHLPLDAHPELGNNAQLARVLEIADPAPTSAGNGLVWQGKLPRPMTPEDLAAHIQQALGRPPLHLGPTGEVRTLAWCTGAAQGFIEQAAALSVEAYLSGEASEQTTHQARELGLHYFAAGHHATERYGVQALGRHLAQQFSLDHRFIDIDNPV